MPEYTPSMAPGYVASLLDNLGHYKTEQPMTGAMAAAEADFDNPPLRDAIQSFQRFHQPLLDQLREEGGELAGVVGEMDRATEQLLDMPRCGLPDIQTAAGPQQANWPPACRMRLTFARLFRSLNPLDEVGTAEAFTSALESIENAIHVGFDEQNELGRGAHIWCDAANMGRNPLAWSYLAVGACAVSLQQCYNSSGVLRSFKLALEVIVHEVGHALGLGHLTNPEAIMYPYARGLYDRFQEPDIVAAVALGYRRRDEEPPDEPAKELTRIIAEFSDGSEVICWPEERRQRPPLSDWGSL